MLRKRSRKVTSKNTIVGDQRNQPWLYCDKPTKSISFFLTSPNKIFKNLFSNSSSSSSSILDPQPFILNPKPFQNPQNLSRNKHIWEQPNNTKGIGVALVDENPSSTKNPRRKLVVFGSHLRIQVPTFPQSSVFPCFSPVSPREFGIKTPRSQIKLSNWDNQIYPEDNISISEMEESEDYTCVISHGPNPKTTHIFGNCIVEKCREVDGSSKLNGFLSSLKNSLSSQSPDSFLSFCHHCNKKLGQGIDIFIYRGEKAFCSQECRGQEMLFDQMES